MYLTHWFGCALGLFGALDVALAKHGDPAVSIVIAPSPGKIFFGEKNVINTTIHFPKKVHEAVKVVLYPALDIPNMVITKVASVKLGKSLKVTGSTVPTMDFGVKMFQVAGRALSCQFDFGHVVDLGGARGKEDKSIEIQYEAMVPEDWEETFGPGNPHQLGVSVESANSNYVMELSNATFAYRTLPLLFRSAPNGRTKFLNQKVSEMTMDKEKPDRSQRPKENFANIKVVPL